MRKNLFLVLVVLLSALSSQGQSGELSISEVDSTTVRPDSLKIKSLQNQVAFRISPNAPQSKRFSPIEIPNADDFHMPMQSLSGKSNLRMPNMKMTQLGMVAPINDSSKNKNLQDEIVAFRIGALSRLTKGSTPIDIPNALDNDEIKLNADDSFILIKPLNGKSNVRMPGTEPLDKLKAAHLIRK